MMQLDQLTTRLVTLPRLMRITIVAFFALMMVFLLFPLIDHIYLRYFYTIETTMIPAIVAVAIGSMSYMTGWWVYVGTAYATPPAEKRVLWYFVIGAITTVLVIGLFVYGVVSLNLPVETA